MAGIFVARAIFQTSAGMFVILIATSSSLLVPHRHLLLSLSLSSSLIATTSSFRPPQPRHQIRAVMDPKDTIKRPYELWDDYETGIVTSLLNENGKPNDDEMEKALEDINSHRLNQNKRARTRKAVAKKIEAIKEHEENRNPPLFNTNNMYWNVHCAVLDAEKELQEIQEKIKLKALEEAIKEKKARFYEKRVTQIERYSQTHALDERLVIIPLSSKTTLNLLWQLELVPPTSVLPVPPTT